MGISRAARRIRITYECNRCVGYRPDDVSKLFQATILSNIHRWNLTMNLPFNVGFKAPFFEERNNNGEFTNRRLNNGRSYRTSHLNHLLLTSHAPFEAPARYNHYSDDLREYIRRCLRYMPEDRVGLVELKGITGFRRESFMRRDGTDDLLVYIDENMEQFRIGNNYDEEEREEFWE
jgi:hypothetical protein